MNFRKEMIFISFLMFILLPAYGQKIYVPAVSEDNHGTLAVLECKVLPGDGKVYVATDPFVGLNTQISERTAVNFVKRYLKTNLQNKDIFFIFHLNNTESIDGPSAGAAMAICLIAELENKTLNPAVSITGTIDEMGNIGPVGGIPAKLEAVSKKCSVFLIPKGQEIYTTTQSRYYSPYPGIYIEEAVPVKVNVTELGKKLGVQVYSVSNVQEALRYFFNTTYERPNIEQFHYTTLFEQMFNALNHSKNLNRLNELARYEITRAENAIKRTNSTVARYYLSLAYSIPDFTPYTKANFAFLAIVSSNNIADYIVRQVVSDLYSKFTKNKLTSDPNWRSEAELRLSWAKYSDEDPNTRMEWALIASKMYVLENKSNLVIPVEYAQVMADKYIKEAKVDYENLKTTGINCGDAEKSLNYAIKSFDDQLYYAAYFNALDAEAWIKACMYGNNLNEKSVQVLVNLTSMNYTDEFSEAYKRHALYLASKGNMKAALYLAFRAYYHSQAYKGISLIPKPIYNNFGLISTIVLSLITLLILFLILKILFKKRKEKLSIKLSMKDELAWVEIKAKIIKMLNKMVDEKKISKEGARKIIELLEEIS